MNAYTRRAALMIAAGLSLMACSQADDGSSTSGTTTSGEVTFVSGTHTLGSADAPVLIEEYASVTCGVCKVFHETVLPGVKERVAAGEVRYEFHEFPTPPGQVAMAGFAMMRCAADGKAFEVLDDLFSNQTGIITAAQNGTVQTALNTVAARHGLSAEEYGACLRNPELIQEIVDVVREGEARGVGSTPTVFLNGERVQNWTGDNLNKLIDEALGIEPDSSSQVEASTEDSSGEGETTETP